MFVEGLAWRVMLNAAGSAAIFKVFLVCHRAIVVAEESAGERAVRTPRLGSFDGAPRFL